MPDSLIQKDVTACRLGRLGGGNKQHSIADGLIQATNVRAGDFLTGKDVFKVPKGSVLRAVLFETNKAIASGIEVQWRPVRGEGFGNWVTGANSLKDASIVANSLETFGAGESQRKVGGGAPTSVADKRLFNDPLDDDLEFRVLFVGASSGATANSPLECWLQLDFVNI